MTFVLLIITKHGDLRLAPTSPVRLSWLDVGPTLTKFLGQLAESSSSGIAIQKLSVCLCVNHVGTNHKRYTTYTYMCNPTCTDLLMNSDQKPETRSAWPSSLGFLVILLIYLSCRLSVTVHCLLVNWLINFPVREEGWVGWLATWSVSGWMSIESYRVLNYSVDAPMDPVIKCIMYDILQAFKYARTCTHLWTPR